MHFLFAQLEVANRYHVKTDGQNDLSSRCALRPELKRTTDNNFAPETAAKLSNGII